MSGSPACRGVCFDPLVPRPTYVGRRGDGDCLLDSSDSTGGEAMKNSSLGLV